MSKITVENVSYVYSGGTPFEMAALNDVSFEINENCITGIIGHTGSGKSTLVQMFNGLLRPSSGRILLDDKERLEKDMEENPGIAISIGNKLTEILGLTNTVNLKKL